jgi:hypothetical protein
MLIKGLDGLVSEVLQVRTLDIGRGRQSERSNHFVRQVVKVIVRQQIGVFIAGSVGVALCALRRITSPLGIQLCERIAQLGIGHALHIICGEVWLEHLYPPDEVSSLCVRERSVLAKLHPVGRVRTAFAELTVGMHRTAIDAVETMVA